MSSDGNSLEDLRSKIIASMSESGGSGGSGDGNKRTRYDAFRSQPRQVLNDSRRGYRNGDVHGNGNANVNDRGRPNYNARNRPRQNNGQQYRSRYNTRGGDSGQGSDAQLQNVIPIDKRERLKPTRWDVTPKGFEKVAAERAKLSGLFPQPGQPQIIDKKKIASVVYHRGRKSRRTRILFEDDAVENINMTKTNSEIIVTIKSSTPDFNMNVFVDTLKKNVSDIIRTFNGDDEFEIKDVRNNLNSVVIEFDCMEISTVILGCQNHLNKKLNFSAANIQWSRPECFLLQTFDAKTSELCHKDIICLDNVEDNAFGKETIETNIKEKLKEIGIQEISYINAIYTKNTTITTNTPIDSQTPPPPPSSIDNTDEFTNSVLIKIENYTTETHNKISKLFSINKPNETNRFQKTQITYQNFPKLTSSNNNTKNLQLQPQSKVLLLLNCVDPLDLKNIEFITEIKDTFYSKFNKEEEQIKDIKIISPTTNYRLNFDHINENIGNIYVLFSNIEYAKNAMNKLTGSKFNDRTILCTSFSEEDYKNLEIL